MLVMVFFTGGTRKIMAMSVALLKASPIVGYPSIVGYKI